jgi:hypothetical protein
LDDEQGNPVARRAIRTGVKFVPLLLLVACGPRVKPDWAQETVEPESKSPPVTTVAPGRGILVGEMCPEGAAGKPAVAPLLVRGVGWSSEPDDVDAAIQRSARAFAVLGLDGHRAGIFEVLGVADVGLPGEVAIGSYAGRSPCAPASQDGGAEDDPACKRATGGCGLAVASIDPASAKADEIVDVDAGGACASGGSLLVDVDGDGASEAFPIAQFVDPVRAPAEEVLAAPVVGAACDATFAVYGLVVTPPPEEGVKDDPRYHVTIDVIAVADLDGDGRRELALSFRYPDGRTVALYSAIRQSGRLELVGEAVPWQ